jgi:hypothetical protein
MFCEALTSWNARASAPTDFPRGSQDFREAAL